MAKARADFTFVTSNEHKVLTAKTVCEQFGVRFERKNIDLTEIQSDDAEAIAADKVRQAFESCRGAVVVTDDNWLIPGLRGFPGPYMKYINQWFRPQDFLNLTDSLEDRRIIMKQVIAYRDNHRQKIFTAEIDGVLLREARGSSVIPHFAVISFDGGQHSVAEAEKDPAVPTAVSQKANAWHQLCDWLQQA